jgi:ubiquinone/menaquinone biosynthesis C-methylase UbiE
MTDNSESLWWRLVRFGFRLLYNEMAFTYDLVSWVVSLGAWRSWQRAAINFLPDPATGVILELAHGTGNLQSDLHAAHYRSIGYDLSPAMGRIAQHKLQQQGISAVLARGRAEQLPFANASFAAVVSTFPTGFIFAPETLHEVNRVLQPGGKMIVVLNGVLTGGGIVKSFLEWLYRITGQRNETGFDVKSLFDGYGFDVSAHEVPLPRSIAQLIVATKAALLD